MLKGATRGLCITNYYFGEFLTSSYEEETSGCLSNNTYNLFYPLLSFDINNKRF